jgi:AraC-like DNA-binding protein
MNPAGLRVHRPAAALAPFVSHYWLGLDNSEAAYRALPDGCVDIVLEVNGCNWRGWAYGTTTYPTDISCRQGSHYLGIRFKPGQSRHFLGVAAHDLTDTRVDLDALMRFPGETVGARIAGSELFHELDRILMESLRAAAPEVSHVDRAVRLIEAAHGNIRVEELARRLGKSRRQIERTFLHTIGVSSKFFMTVVRTRCAARLIVDQRQRALCELAVAAGYADQSHMTRDFSRLIGASPASLRREQVAFLQDSAAA